MRFNDFLALPHEKRVGLLRQNIDENIGDIVAAFDMGHTAQFHAGMDARFHIPRVINSGRASSSFASQDAALTAVGETLYASAPAIVGWLNDTDGVANPPRLRISADYGVEVGTGLTPDFKEVSTRGVHAVLAANRQPRLQDGCAFFNVITFYPLLSHPSTKETGRSFAKEAEEMINASKDLVVRGCWGLRSAGFDSEIKTSAARGYIFAETHFDYNGKTFSVLCNANTTSYSTPYISLLDKGTYTKLTDLPPGSLSIKEHSDIIAQGKIICAVFSDAEKGVHLPWARENLPEAQIEDESGIGLGDGDLDDIGGTDDHDDF